MPQFIGRPNIPEGMWQTAINLLGKQGPNVAGGIERGIQNLMAGVKTGQARNIQAEQFASKQAQDLKLQESKIEADKVAKQGIATEKLAGEQKDIDNVKLLANQVQSGNLTIQQIKGRGNAAMSNKVVAEVTRRDPNFDFLKGAGKLAGEKKAGSLAGAIGSEPDWQKLGKAINPRTAPRSSLIGMAGQVNMRADRATKALSPENGVVNPQRIALAIADLAAIMKGGTPTDSDMAENRYGTWFDSVARLAQKVSANPISAGQPAIVAELKKIISEVKDVDNGIIREQLEFARQTHKKTIASDPSRYESMADNIHRSTQLYGSENAAEKGPGEKPEMSATNPETGDRIFSNDGGITWTKANGQPLKEDK